MLHRVEGWDIDEAEAGLSRPDRRFWVVRFRGLGVRIGYGVVDIRATYRQGLGLGSELSDS